MKNKFASGNPEEDLYRTLSQHVSREICRAEADALFGGMAAENRKKDRDALEKLFIQTPAAQVQSVNLLKESAVFGASEPDEIEHTAIPYKFRRDAFSKYLNEKSKEKETGYGKGGGVGAAVGGALGAIAGGIASKSLGGAVKGGVLGSGAGGVIGLALAHADKGNIAEAREVLKNGNLDAHLAQRISAKIESREARKQMQQALEHAETVAAIHQAGKNRSTPSEVHHFHHEPEHKATGKCSHCGAPAPTSGSKCEFCGRHGFEKNSSIAPNVDAFFEKLSAANGPDEAQTRYPELLKVAQRPSPSSKGRTASTSPSQSMLSGGAA